MSKSARNTILWLLFLLIAGLYCYTMTRTPRIDTVKVGPHKTYTWYNGSKSVLLGDGQTQVFLESTYGNFTVYDEGDLYVTSGQPTDMLPGDTKQAFVANFPLTEGKKYDLSDSPVEIYTLEPTTLTFESYRFGYMWLVIACLVLALFTIVLI